MDPDEFVSLKYQPCLVPMSVFNFTARDPPLELLECKRIENGVVVCEGLVIWSREELD